MSSRGEVGGLSAVILVRLFLSHYLKTGIQAKLLQSSREKYYMSEHSSEQLKMFKSTRLK